MKTKIIILGLLLSFSLSNAQADPYVWTFNRDLDQWGDLSSHSWAFLTTHQFPNETLNSGHLELKHPAGSVQNWIFGPTSLSLNIDELKHVHFSLTLNNGGDIPESGITALLVWTPAGNMEILYTQAFQLYSGQKEYHIDLSSHADWNGDININRIHLPHGDFTGAGYTPETAVYALDWFAISAEAVFDTPVQDVRELWLPAIFSDNMVLQQNSDVTIWGETADNAPVEISSSWGGSASTVANSYGDWKMTIATGSADNNAESFTITSGPYSKSFNNVLIGEVWLASGQSNMQMGLVQSAGGGDAVNSSENDQLRLFNIATNGSLEPQDNVNGTWQVSSPSTSPMFSAVAYYYADKLQKTLDVPVGMIHGSWGASNIETWMSKETLMSLGVSIPTEMGSYVQLTPTACFNSMIYPIIGYNLKGVIWYQGEANLGNYTKYQEYFEAYTASWRQLWRVGDFPFYYAQIAAYDYGSSSFNYMAAKVREAQFNAMETVPNCGMVVTLDVSNCADIHPLDKNTVGDRLANWALVKDYGFSEADYPIHGPTLNAIEERADTLILHFDHALSLNTGGEVLADFYVSATGATYLPASASIENDTTVSILSPVSSPKYIRYASTGCAEASLFNEDDLPAPPFMIEVSDYSTSSVSISSFNEKEEVVLYPNPAQQRLIIKGIDKEASVNFYDLAGKNVLQTTINPSQEIGLPLEKGIYIVRIQNSSNSFQKMLIVN
ncbi:MAG: sialate O-acetylesterase [Bacteroidota bacterium]